MTRPVSLFTGQFGDLKREKVFEMMKAAGFNSVELACWGKHGSHFNANAAILNTDYCGNLVAEAKSYGLDICAISDHLTGQGVGDIVDERHQAILSEEIWGDGNPEDVNKRAADQMIVNGKAAKILAEAVGHPIDVIGFTGSTIWKGWYDFPPPPKGWIDEGFAEFARRWGPILDAFLALGVRFGLEVHPTEIAFDPFSLRRAIEAVNGHPSFCINYDPSHLFWQGVDYVEYILEFGERIIHVHMKDAFLSNKPGPIGILGGHSGFGNIRRRWDFRSLGRGGVNFEEILRALNAIKYIGALSVEWEDSGMDREHCIKEACEYVKQKDFEASETAFDAAFGDKE